MKTIQFTKMHGAGNDYICVDTISQELPKPAEGALSWRARHTGIGSDGLILIGRSDKADFSMRMFNNDGSEGRMCGNGIRCVGKYVYDHGMTHSKEVSIETLAGIKLLHLHTDAEDRVDQVKVDMGEPILADPTQLATPDGSLKEGTVSVGNRNYIGTFVSMGNPHFVIFVDDIQSVDLSGEGPALENLPLFPQKCNIEFAQLLSDGSLRTRVWERGTGITMACGTGACATAVAAKLCGLNDGHSTIKMDGGTLSIEWSENGHIFMTGPATTVFEGTIKL